MNSLREMPFTKVGFPPGRTTIASMLTKCNNIGGNVSFLFVTQSGKTGTPANAVHVKSHAEVIFDILCLLLVSFSVVLRGSSRKDKDC